MRLGINLLLFGAGLTEETGTILKRVRDIGYTHVEIPVFERNLSRCREVARVAADHGLTVSVSSALPHGASLAGDEGALRAAVAFHRMLVESAVLLGAKMIIGPLYHPVGEMISPCDQVRLQRRVADALAGEIAPLYIGEGLRFALEPLNRFETNVVNTCADAASLCDVAPAGWIGVLTDTFHQHIEESDAVAPLRALGRYWIHAHASENHRGVAGAGQVAWESWAAALSAAGPDLVVFESFGGTVPALAAATRVWRDLTGDPVACARQSFRFLNSLLNHSKS